MSDRYGAIIDWTSLTAALKKSLDFFCEVGCRVTDHAFIHFRYAVGDPAPVMEKALSGSELKEEETAVYQGTLLRFLAGEYTKRDMAMQLHLNPADSAMLSTMAVNFAADGAKAQYGAARWLLDHYHGISERIDQLMETGLLSGSVGMLTDSHGFTSFARHEYFRHILCNKMGELVERDEYPNDLELLGEMVEDICWRNAVKFFGFEIV